MAQSHRDVKSASGQNKNIISFNKLLFNDRLKPALSHTLYRSQLRV